MISLSDVEKWFGSKKALGPVNVDFQPGKVHVLLGTSGCGKTTMLRLICGLTKATQGRVSIEGCPIQEFDRQRLSQSMGYVIQEGGLFPHLTSKENIELPCKIHQIDLDLVQEKIHQYCAMVKLDPNFLNRYPKELSGGQRQRVALIRGLVHGPSIILLDEPLSALDPLVRANLQRQLKKIFEKDKKTVILVTHDLHEASYLGDHIHLLSKGSIVQQGTFEDIYKNPATDFVEEFLRAQIPLGVHL